LEERSKVWFGAFVCIFNKSFSKILLLSRNWKKKKREGKVWESKATWGNIGGSMEAGETPQQACVREAGEEIGVRLNPKDLVQVHVKKRPVSELKPYVVRFYATTIDEGTKINLNDESYKYRWFSIEKLPNETLDKKEDIIEWRNLAMSSLGASKDTSPWKGVILEESLSDKSLLNLVKIVGTDRSKLEGEDRYMTFHNVTVEDSKIKGYLEKAMKAIKPGFYTHVCKDGVMYVIFKDKSFTFKKDDPELQKARRYGESQGILKEQMNFEHIIDNPFD
jgi:8-oxo-dGTP pyrophosphatase MutT (NUDIX family)